MSDSIKNTVASRIVHAREQLGLTQIAFIELINQDPDIPKDGKKHTDGKEYVGLQFERYKKWESGENKIPISWIPVLCKHLQCDVGYLFGDYASLKRSHADICEETGLSKTAVEVLCSLKNRANNSLLVANVLETLSLLLENTDERKSMFEVVPLLEYISAYLNCAPQDERIVSVEADGKVIIFESRESFEAEPGEAISGDYMRQIIKTRLEQRVMDELKSFWNEKNGESRKTFHQRILQEAQQNQKERRLKQKLGI